MAELVRRHRGGNAENRETVRAPSVLKRRTWYSDIVRQQEGLQDTNSQMCRICLGSACDEKNPLIFPCHCTTPVHEECLSTWRTAGVNRKSFYGCEICNGQYTFTGTEERMKALVQTAAVIGAQLLLAVVAVGFLVYVLSRPVARWYSCANSAIFAAVCSVVEDQSRRAFVFTSLWVLAGLGLASIGFGLYDMWVNRHSARAVGVDVCCCVCDPFCLHNITHQLSHCSSDADCGRFALVIFALLAVVGLLFALVVSLSAAWRLATYHYQHIYLKAANKAVRVVSLRDPVKGSA